jgi:hypothetical protein
MAHALQTLPVLKLYRITLLTSNKAAAITLGNPQHQLGQEHIQADQTIAKKRYQDRDPLGRHQR